MADNHLKAAARLEELGIILSVMVQDLRDPNKDLKSERVYWLRRELSRVTRALDPCEGLTLRNKVLFDKEYRSLINDKEAEHE